MSHHFRSYSESTNGQFQQLHHHHHHHPQHQQQQHTHLHNQHQPQQQHHQPIQPLISSHNQQQVIIKTNPIKVPDDDGILVHSDSQQSLDRLFNPPANEASVPLRNRNLPESFFKPTPMIAGRLETSNLHCKSTSVDLRSKPLAGSVHMRTQSVLAPMQGLVSSPVNSNDKQSNGCSTHSLHQINGSQNGSTQNLHQHGQQALQSPQPNTVQPVLQQHQQVGQVSNMFHYRNYSSPAQVPNNTFVNGANDNHHNNHVQVQQNRHNGHLVATPLCQQHQNQHLRTIAQPAIQHQTVIGNNNNNHHGYGSDYADQPMVEASQYANCPTHQVQQPATTQYHCNSTATNQANHCNTHTVHHHHQHGQQAPASQNYQTVQVTGNNQHQQLHQNQNQQHYQNNHIRTLPSQHQFEHHQSVQAQQTNLHVHSQSHGHLNQLNTSLPTNTNGGQQKFYISHSHSCAPSYNGNQQHQLAGSTHSIHSRSSSFDSRQTGCQSTLLDSGMSNLGISSDGGSFTSSSSALGLNGGSSTHFGCNNNGDFVQQHQNQHQHQHQQHHQHQQQPSLASNMVAHGNGHPAVASIVTTNESYNQIPFSPMMDA